MHLLQNHTQTYRQRVRERERDLFERVCIYTYIHIIFHHFFRLKENIEIFQFYKLQMQDLGIFVRVIAKEMRQLSKPTPI